MASVFLPMFPLRLVAFPGEEINLHIFEPRYKQLILECETKGTAFGIPAFFDDKVQQTGSEIQLLAIEQRYPNGEMDIRTKAVGIFRILEFFPQVENRLYGGAEVERLSYNLEGDFFKNKEILEQLAGLYRILGIKKEIPKLNSSFHSYEVAHLIGLSLEQEYELLCIADEYLRQEFMLRHFERLIPIAREMEELRKKVQMNGHFKNILPPKL